MSENPPLIERLRRESRERAVAEAQALTAAVVAVNLMDPDIVAESDDFRRGYARGACEMATAFALQRVEAMFK